MQQGAQQLQQGRGNPLPTPNFLPTPPATLKVSGIPSFATQDDFSRLMRQLEGCLDARLLGRQPGGDQIGYAEFSDKMNASKAKNLYHGWTGWGGRGLGIELTDFSMSQLTQLPGQKRMREGEDLLQVNGNYKQPRPSIPAMSMIGGFGSTQQQQHHVLGGQSGTQQQDASAMGLLQNLSNMTNLLQQQGIAQQLLTATQQQQQQQQSHGGILQPQHLQQQLPGMMAQQPTGQQQLGGGMPGGTMQGQVPGLAAADRRFEGYNTGATNQQQQQVAHQQLGGMVGSMLPQQQQPTTQYVPQVQQQLPQQYSLQQEPPATGYMNQTVQQQQLHLQQPMPQQSYSLMPPQQQQAPATLQTGVGQVLGVLPQQQPMMQQQPPQMMQPPQPLGMGMPGGRRGEIVAPTTMRQYPSDACNTLYVEGLPPDVTRRELAHIFRSREGYRSLRLVIKDSKKHAGEKLVMVFVEYSNTYFATEAMDALQGYRFDMDDPETTAFFIKYARPMENTHRRPPGGSPMMGGRGRGGGPDVHAGRGGLDGRSGRGGGRGSRFGAGGLPPRESPRRGDAQHYQQGR